MAKGKSKSKSRKDKITELFAGIKYQNPKDKEHEMNVWLNSDLTLEFIESHVKLLLAAGYDTKPIADRSTNNNNSIPNLKQDMPGVF